MKHPGPVDDARPQFSRPRDWIIGFVILAAVIVGVALTVGWGQLLAPWLELSPLALATLLGLSALSYFLRAVRVWDYFRPRFDGRFLTVLRLSVLHNVANNLLPMRAGEMVFPWLMRRYFGHGFMDATASLVWIRLLDLHFLGLIGIVILYLREPTWIWPAAGVLWLGMVPLVGLTRRLTPAGDGRLSKALRLAANAAPDSTPRVLRVYFWTALTWGTKFLSLAAVLHHFLPVDLWKVMLGVMGAELSSVLPFHGIAGSGTYELAAVAALIPFGISAREALAGAVNLHLFLLGVTLILGLLALLLPVRRAAVADADCG
jgi:uncharacterized membrane protein YbhN (UPF0104 family)